VFDCCAKSVFIFGLIQVHAKCVFLSSFRLLSFVVAYELSQSLCVFDSRRNSSVVTFRVLAKCVIVSSVILISFIVA
jgi:hypothetical protein